MADYTWKPIIPLSEEDRNIDLASITPLYDTWKKAKERLEESSPAGLTEFTDRLVRRLSIETGILERLYDLDRGTTEVLVAEGFVEELISRSSTDIDPARLIDILRDQEAAIQLVMDCVAGNRDLTKSVIHELHSILMNHQETTRAINQFDKKIDILLIKGQYKEHQNNPKRPDETIHEYCPPIHVESEMDNLLLWLSEYQDEDPVVTSAWFHHRFTQIHPYQDGNGRLARALTTLILLRSSLLPVVIDRDHRSEYIRSLEAADNGNLAALAVLFARLVREAILEAVSIEEDAKARTEHSLSHAVILSLSDKINKRKMAKDTKLRGVNDLAKSLRVSTRVYLEAVLHELEEPLAQIAVPQIHVTLGGPDYQSAHWYKYDVVQSANPRSTNATGTFVNFEEDHYFVKASVRAGTDRLIFVVSFHHVGRDLSGIMEATAFARLESFEDPNDRDRVSQDFFPCSLEPFVFTYQTEMDDVSVAFSAWLDAAAAVAIKEYSDRL